MQANADMQSLKAARGGIGICKHELQEAARSLRAHYDAISGWGSSDAKYIKLGGIIDECCTALNQPVKQLEQCAEEITGLIKALEDYENAL